MGFRSIRRSDIYVTLHTFSWEFACFFWGGIFKGFRLILVEMSRLATTSRYVNLQKSEGRVQNQEVELFAEVERLQCVRHALFTCFPSDSSGGFHSTEIKTFDGPKNRVSRFVSQRI